MSDTPRTDADAFDDGLGSTDSPQIVVYAEFARQLERELAETKALLDRYTRMSESGETLGDCLDEREDNTELRRLLAERDAQLAGLATALADLVEIAKLHCGVGAFIEIPDNADGPLPQAITVLASLPSSAKQNAAILKAAKEVEKVCADIDTDSGASLDDLYNAEQSLCKAVRGEV